MPWQLVRPGPGRVICETGPARVTTTFNAFRSDGSGFRLLFMRLIPGEPHTDRWKCLIISGQLEGIWVGFWVCLGWLVRNNGVL
jgi:hypothetical protein